ncbi:MAG: hypothetical protein AB7O52_08795 [Planctomycetota bacterium]
MPDPISFELEVQDLRSMRTPRRPAVGAVVLALLGALLSGGCTGSSRPTPLGVPLNRGTVYVKIEETLDGEPTAVNLIQELVTRRLLYHGFHLVEAPERARYRVEGSLHCRFHKDHTFDFGDQSTHLEYQFEAQLDCTLTDTQGTSGDTPDPLTERFAFPEPLIYGRTQMAAAKRDIRRYAESIFSPQLLNGRILGNPEVKALVDALGNPYDTRTFNEVLDGLVRIGPRAVPYLLDGLTDSRPVRLAGTYPGLEDWNRDSLHFAHIFDRALGEILQRYSPLTLDSTEELLLRVQRGWTWAWEDLQQIPETYRAFAAERKDVVPSPRPGEPLPDGLQSDH